MEYIIGIAIGSLLGLTGAGGSLCAVPLLILLLHLSPVEATGIALGAVAVSAVFGVLRQAKNVLWFPGGLLAVSGMLTAPLGRALAFTMSEQWLMISFCILAIAIAVHMWLQASKKPEQASILRGAVDKNEISLPKYFCSRDELSQYRLTKRCFFGLIGGGLAIGFFSGLFGVGGGFLIVPYLLFLGQITMRVAVATSLLIIVLVSSSGFASYLLLTPQLNTILLAKVTVAAIVGMLASQLLSSSISGVVIQKIFSVILVLLSLVMLLRSFIG